MGILLLRPQQDDPHKALKDKGIVDKLTLLIIKNLRVALLPLENHYCFEGKVDEGFLFGYSVSSSGPTWLFDIDSLSKTMNYQPVTAGNQTNPSAGFQDKFDAEKAREEINQQYVLFLVWSSGSTNPKNYDGDAAFDGKEHDFDAKKPESEVILSPSSSAQSRKQDDKTKKEAKGKSPVESFTGYRDLSAEFEDCSDNSSNEVNATGTIVLTVGQNSSNSTNPFSAASLLNTTASPTHGKSSFIDASQLFDDPDMPELKDITYSDDENDVGAEADFNNLETSITEEPKRVHQTLKDPSCIEAMNKKDERGIVVRNKARLVAQGHTEDEGIDYEEVFAPASWALWCTKWMSRVHFYIELLRKKCMFVNLQGLRILIILTKWSRHFMVYIRLLELDNERQVPDEFYGGTHILFGSSGAMDSESTAGLWATVSIKKANDVVKLQALIDGKRLVITEDVIWQALHLDDADGVDAKRTTWNEFSCSMASAVICLATVYIPCSYSKDFCKYEEVGKGFSGVKTPLFATMIVQPQPPAAEEEDEVEMPNASTPSSPTTAPSPPLQEPIPKPPQAQPAPLSSPPQEQ
nr:ribonuclease H-like domain-containing protein [Tanacetum cinerariifolium]